MAAGKGRLLLLGLSLGVCSCTPDGGERRSALPAIRFREVATEAGLGGFQHETGARGQRRLPEVTIGGAGWIDADGDGLLDLFLANGNLHSARGGEGEAATCSRLYRNLGGGRFADATEASGLGDRGYACGVAVGDYDNDGDSDLYLTRLGSNVLYRNEGGGRFADVTAAAGVAAGGWSASAAFVDVDQDGLLDLYVCRYLDYDPERACQTAGRPVYCSPKEFSGLPDRLYRNRGDGSFEDLSARAGVGIAGPAEGKSLGVVAFDFDVDGDQDLYVACDQVPNLLFENQGGGRFREVGLLANAAYSESGQSQAGMGVDAADLDLDGREDLVVTNFALEYNTFYRNLGDGTFADLSTRVGLAALSVERLGFGVALFDPDLDGDLDLAFANGHVTDNIAELQPSMSFRQRAQLIESLEGKAFRDASSDAGGWFSRPVLGRALATADFDEDGDEDFVMVDAGGKACLLRNDSVGRGRWIALKLVGRRSNRDGYGARAALQARRGAVSFSRVVSCRSARSYLAACDPRLRFGLGPEPVEVESIEIRWPSGVSQTLARPAIDRVHRVEEP
jgi:hypothetical protein